MDIFLTIVGIAILAGLLHIAWTEWQKASKEQKMFMIEALVAAAQQLYGNDPGAMRFEWVSKRIKERWPNFDEHELEALIEAAVYRLKVFAGLIAKKEMDEEKAMYWVGTGRHN
ncbi:MAG: hypothetical protein R2932_59205 [Caldilineaceae bacterium]